MQEGKKNEFGIFRWLVRLFVQYDAEPTSGDYKL